MKRLLALILLAWPVLAQPPQNFFPWWDSPVARELKLTDAQRQQIQDTLRESRDRMIDLRAVVEKAEAEVEDRFNDDPVDVRRTGEAIDKLIVARSELMKLMSHMNLKMRAVLTSEQWRELQKRQKNGPPPGLREGRPPFEGPRDGPREGPRRNPQGNRPPRGDL